MEVLLQRGKLGAPAAIVAMVKEDLPLQSWAA